MTASLPPLRSTRLAQPAPARVLACGAWLKNTACLIEGDTVWWSPEHGDLGEPGARAALEASVERLLAVAGGPVQATAHDLHPDFPSTHLAQALAHRLGVPALGVQHHHAHIGVVLAEQAVAQPVVGLALDGVGLGTDGSAWGGEVLWVDASPQAHRWRREHHLPALRLPGGDAAAREPWRMAAAVLHAEGMPAAIEARFGPVVGVQTARGVTRMLERGLNCPVTTSAGRWFDAVAGLLRLSVVQQVEAEAARAVETAASGWWARHPESAGPSAAPGAPGLRGLGGELLALCPPELDGPALAEAQGRGAAHFHQALVDTLVHAVEAVQGRAGAAGLAAVAAGGGCFFNRLLSDRLADALARRGLPLWRPQSVNCGDAGLALGQAWVAACRLAADPEAEGPVEPLAVSISLP